MAPLAGRVAYGLAADRRDVDHPAVAVGREGRVHLLGERGDLARRRRGEVAATEPPAGEQAAVLHQDHPLPHQKAPAEKVGERTRAETAGRPAGPVFAEAAEPGGPQGTGGRAGSGSEKAHRIGRGRGLGA